LPDYSCVLRLGLQWWFGAGGKGLSLADHSLCRQQSNGFEHRRRFIIELRCNYAGQLVNELNVHIIDADAARIDLATGSAC
jgi:hypothetical protein